MAVHSDNHPRGTFPREAWKRLPKTPYGLDGANWIPPHVCKLLAWGDYENGVLKVHVPKLVAPYKKAVEHMLGRSITITEKKVERIHASKTGD